jgi:hypothetical protein
MELRVHLKVCEGCGCLWYRVQAETSVYCSSCIERFKEFPKVKTRIRSGRPRKVVLPTVFAVQAAAGRLAERDQLPTRPFPVAARSMNTLDAAGSRYLHRIAKPAESRVGGAN